MSRGFTTVYSVAGGDTEDVFYVPTLAEARRAKRDIDSRGDHPMGDAYITRNVVVELPRRELVCRLLNGESWSIESEDVR